MTFRRTLAVLSLTVGSAMCLQTAQTAAQSLPDLKGKTFIFGGFGGDLQKNQDLAWLKPFITATGVKIDQTDLPDVAALKTQEDAKNVALDVIEIEASTVDANCGTMFEKVKIERSAEPQTGHQPMRRPRPEVFLCLGVRCEKIPHCAHQRRRLLRHQNVPGHTRDPQGFKRRHRRSRVAG